MEEKTYEFYGVDAKTELKIGIIVGVNTILTLFVLFLLFPTGNLRTNLFVIALTLLWDSVVIKFFSKKNMRLWSLTKINDKLIIKYKEEMHEIPLKDIVQINILGSIEHRYFTIKYNSQSVRIRVGTSWMAPFSRKGDLQILDSFIKKLTNFLNKNFTKKDRKLSIAPKGTVKLTYTRKEKEIL